MKDDMKGKIFAAQVAAMTKRLLEEIDGQMLVGHPSIFAGLRPEKVREPQTMLGMEIVESPYVPRTAPRQVLHRDWRERQRRNMNLARVSRPPRYPLYYTVEEPVVFIMKKQRYNILDNGDI